jgi:hypothetical protein
VTERPTYPKSTCCIAGCPRWSRRFKGEWICAQHWRSVPLPIRQGWRKFTDRRYAEWVKADAEEGAAREAWLLNDHGGQSLQGSLYERMNALITANHRARLAYWRTNRLWWRRIKREATLRAAGL